ncbi:MAG: hypothetical protein ABJN69_08875 [Hellea sp.]
MTNFLQHPLKALKLNKSAKSYMRGAIVIGIVLYLFYKLSQIGWAEIMAALPSSPLFYGLSIAVLLLPIWAERSAFKIVTENKIAAPFKVFARKHVMNKAVLAYSGEAYLIHELSEKAGLNVKRAAIIIKDLALLRTFVANLWVIILAGVAVVFGQSETLQNIAQASPALVVIVGLICVLVCSGTVIFFKKISNLPYGNGAKVAGVFLLRSLLIAAIMIAQWNLAIPGTPLSAWFIFMVVFSIARKSPIGGEMVFISVALTLPGLESQNASVAAMLMTILALNQLNYLITFLLTSGFPDLRKNKMIELTAKAIPLSTNM